VYQPRKQVPGAQLRLFHHENSSITPHYLHIAILCKCTDYISFPERLLSPQQTLCNGPRHCSLPCTCIFAYLSDERSGRACEVLCVTHDILVAENVDEGEELKNSLSSCYEVARISTVIRDILIDSTFIPATLYNVTRTRIAEVNLLH
jgi:hypothetical protein